MLYFYEGPGSTVDVAAAEKFESDYDSDAYEAKIARLLRRVYKHDSTLGQQSSWQDAIRTLRREDRYILVMVDQAGIKGASPSILEDLLTSRLMILTIFAAIGFIIILAVFQRNWIPRNDMLRAVVFFSFIALVWGLGKITMRRG